MKRSLYFAWIFCCRSFSTQLNAKGGRYSPSGMASSPSLFPQIPANSSTREYQGATSSYPIGHSIPYPYLAVAVNSKGLQRGQALPHLSDFPPTWNPRI